MKKIRLFTVFHDHNSCLFITKIERKQHAVCSSSKAFSRAKYLYCSRMNVSEMIEILRKMVFIELNKKKKINKLNEQKSDNNTNKKVKKEKCQHRWKALKLINKEFSMWDKNIDSKNKFYEKIVEYIFHDASAMCFGVFHIWQWWFIIHFLHVYGLTNEIFDMHNFALQTIHSYIALRIELLVEFSSFYFYAAIMMISCLCKIYNSC